MWLDEALEQGVISQVERDEILALTKDASGYVFMPPHLESACQRLFLWELDTEEMVCH